MDDNKNSSRGTNNTVPSLMNKHGIELQSLCTERQHTLSHTGADKRQHNQHIYTIPIENNESHQARSDSLSSVKTILLIPSNTNLYRTILSMENKELTIMARSILSVLIFILLPLVLLIGIIFRYSLTSFLYAFLLLILPWLGPITEKSIRSRFPLFILLIGLISLLTIVAQIIFQSILVANKPYGHILSNCSDLTETLRYFGLERLDNSNAIRILRLIFPDVIILAVSTICVFVIRYRVVTSRRREVIEDLATPASPLTISSNSSTAIPRKIWPRLLSLMRRVRLFIQFVVVGFAAIVYPSILNSVYFVFFLTLAFIWSLSVNFGTKYVYARVLLALYAGLHILTFYVYQFGFFQDALHPLSFTSNITGLTAIVTTNCTDKEPFLQRKLTWTDYVNPCALLILYFYFAFETNRKLSQKVRSNTTTIQTLEQQSLVQSSEGRDNIEQSSPVLHRRWSREQPGDQTCQGRIIFVVFSVFRVLERQSYLLSLIAMLAWSITFHSLLTLVYLLWACFIWVLPNSRQWCLRMSPFFTVYGGVLLILQYLVGFKISFDQLNFSYDRRTMEQIGIRIDDFQPAFIPLLLKSFYMMFFWLTLRQYINEKRITNTHTPDARRSSTSNESYPRRLGRWLINLFTKYWIFLSCGMLLLVSIQNTVVIYRIIYMAFYLFFILSFQISFGFWRKTAATFHLVIIIYSMIVLIGLYIYQFEKVNTFLSTKLSKELLESIGLEVVPSDVLAVKLLTPSTFLVVNILQLYYFHSDWMKLITMPSQKEFVGPANGTLQDIHAYARENTFNLNKTNTEQILEKKTRNWQEKLYKVYFRANRLYKQMIYYAWRIAELHTFKLVLLVMVLTSVFQTCAFNIILIILATIGLASGSCRKIINLLGLIATGVYILASMCYQLEIAKQHIVEQNFFVRNCSDNNSTDMKIPNDTAKWFGLELTSSIDRFIGLYILLTIVLTFDAIAQYRQQHRRLLLSVHFNVQLVQNSYPILFEPFAIKKNPNDDTCEFDMVNYRKSDTTIYNFLKYLANFIFYRFGLEICYTTTVIVVAARLDMVAVLYAIWLGVFLVSSRGWVQRMWPAYVLFLIIAFPLQYMSAIGAPPFLCFKYPWTNASVTGWSQVKRWLFLPDYVNPPNATQLIGDFFQLLFACQQWRVFKYEANTKDPYVKAGGLNCEIIYDKDQDRKNRTWDFVMYRRHWFDQFKYIIFMYSAWTVLSIVYLAGTTRISLLGLGYLIACFYFFWYGQDFLTKQVAVMLRIWSFLIYYCFAVIFIKTCLQVAVCIFLYSMIPCEGVKRTSSFCTFVDLLVPCLRPDLIPPRNCPALFKGSQQQCDRNPANANLFMDGFCMLCLLLQKRIFGSYHWEHIVGELRLQAKLASQGAVLFNQITRERMQELFMREKQTVDKITESLNRIKQQQLKSTQADNKAAAALADSSEHFEAIRSGDYYMFDSQSDEEEDEGKQDEATVAQEQIIQVLAARDKYAAAAAAAQKPPSTSIHEPENEEFIPSEPYESPDPPATTTDAFFGPPTEAQEGPSVEPKEGSDKSGQSILLKISLIGQIVSDYFINLFDRCSHDYREVSKQLAVMKAQDKVNQQQERRHAQAENSTPTTVDGQTPRHTTVAINDSNAAGFTSQTSELKQRSRLYRFADSLFYFTMSRSELLCYAAMVINHLTSGALLSMPLPLSIFLWAMLSSRPSRNYWITIITYTEAMIVIKYIFQFRFYPWNTTEITETNPLTPVHIIGIDRKENAASAADLFLLLSLFVHRSILKQLGLWKADRNAIEDSAELNPVVSDDQQALSSEEPKPKTSYYCFDPIINFYRRLKQALFVQDVYASLFFCDFINMIIVICFYSQFGERAAGNNVVQTIKENKVPIAFLVMLLVQFLLIIIDRALYLRRNVRGKLFFQLFQVIGVHVWLFFILPGITHMKFRDNVAAQFWYLFKCIYFGYSSIQVRLGYPRRIAGNFLMKRFNYVNQILYRIYLLIPFLLELRTIMDWIFTDTALGLSSWLQLEDIYSNVYLLKCARWAEKKYPTERGVTRSKLTKYGVGGTLLVLIILLIWFPLLFFSFSSSFYQPNPPNEVNVEIKLGPYLPIYQMTAQDIDLIPFSSSDSKRLRDKIDSLNIDATLKDSAYGFLRDFNSDDIRCINLFATSVDIWDISQPIRDAVVNNLRSNVTVPVRFSYTIRRSQFDQDSTGDSAGMVSGENIVSITANDQAIRKALIAILNGTVDEQVATNFTILNLLPRFLHVKAKSKPEEIPALKNVFLHDYHANITMGLNRTKNIPNSTDVWWEVSEVGNKYTYTPSCAYSINQNYLSMLFFNDKVSPANISFLTRYGIIGLYTTFVVVVARLLRTLLQTSRTIIFYELPNVERLWHLLRDIYLVRENNRLLTEEELFAKLLFLYRSPETLIRFTKPKSE